MQTIKRGLQTFMDCLYWTTRDCARSEPYYMLRCWKFIANYHLLLSICLSIGPWVLCHNAPLRIVPFQYIIDISNHKRIFSHNPHSWLNLKTLHKTFFVVVVHSVLFAAIVFLTADLWIHKDSSLLKTMMQVHLWRMDCVAQRSPLASGSK